MTSQRALTPLSASLAAPLESRTTNKDLKKDLMRDLFSLLTPANHECIILQIVVSVFISGQVLVHIGDR